MSNTIKLKKYVDVINEYEAASEIIPGQLVQLDSTGKAKPHATAGGLAEKAFALEDELQGKGIDDAYVAGDRVQVMYARPGDEVYALLNTSATAVNIAIGDFLESAGNGNLQKYGTVSATATLPPIAIALEALTTDATTLPPIAIALEALTTDATIAKRIKVRIV